MIATTFKFADLGDEAKLRAIDWYREGVSNDWEPSFEFVGKCFELLGIDFDVSTDVRYSLGYCQGDGAVFSGTWYAKNVNLGELMEYAPRDDVIHNIGARLMAVVLKYPDGECGIHTRSTGPGLPYQYVNDAFTGRCDSDGQHVDMDDETYIALHSITGMLNGWVYNYVREDLEHQTSNESCIAGIESMDYDFDEDGKPV